jgi:hypothetical protein
MGEHWVAVRKAAHEQTLRQGDPPVRHVAERWEQFTQYLCLSLNRMARTHHDTSLGRSRPAWAGQLAPCLPVLAFDALRAGEMAPRGSGSAGSEAPIVP